MKIHPRPRRISAEQRDRWIRQLRDLLQNRSEILLAMVHGSFLADGPFRDVDLALYLDPGVVRQEVFRDYELEQGVRWSEELGLPVDVRLLNDAPLSFRYHALRGTVMFVRQEAFLDEFRAKTWDEYCDFAPFARRYFREVVGE
ncbi:MAG: nucleotidyltransferase domain-containing protein [Nitrospira sp.]|nr:nucleotidyltransferase domain-containing protein [Nitrospira sp.]